MIRHGILQKSAQNQFKISPNRSIHQCLRNFQSKSDQNSGHISRRRVVVTGLGVVSPVGCDTKLAWANILNGYCGIKALSDPSYKQLPCKIAAQIEEENVKLGENFSKSELRSIAPATAYALIAGNLDNFR